jgi:hypothetical protein
MKCYADLFCVDSTGIKRRCKVRRKVRPITGSGDRVSFVCNKRVNPLDSFNGGNNDDVMRDVMRDLQTCESAGFLLGWNE